MFSKVQSLEIWTLALAQLLDPTHISLYNFSPHMPIIVYFKEIFSDLDKVHVDSSTFALFYTKKVKDRLVYYIEIHEHSFKTILLEINPQLNLKFRRKVTCYNLMSEEAKNSLLFLAIISLRIKLNATRSEG